MFRVLCFVLMCACIQPAFAQTSVEAENKDWQVSTFGGGSFLGNSTSDKVGFLGNSTSGKVGMHYSSGYEVGVRLSENLGNFWGADLEYSFANQPLTLTNLTRNIQSLSLSHSVHHISYSVSYIALPRSSRFRPYAKIGTGAALFYIDKSSKHDALREGLALRDSWKFLVNWGGGFTYLFHEPVAITFDVKDYVTGVPTYSLPLSHNGLMNNWQVGFGFNFQWDD